MKFHNEQCHSMIWWSTTMTFREISILACVLTSGLCEFVKSLFLKKTFQSNKSFKFVNMLQTGYKKFQKYTACDFIINIRNDTTYFFHLVTSTVSPILTVILGSSVHGMLKHTLQPLLIGNNAPL